MKLVLTLLGVVLLVIAAVYFLVPADQLPGFFPGHEDGVARVHMKHGVVSGVAGLVLLAAGIWVGRR
jgi:rhodanese-related sulfurtransferase